MFKKKRRNTPRVINGLRLGTPRRRGSGWFKESKRHSDARKGKTSMGHQTRTGIQPKMQYQSVIHKQKLVDQKQVRTPLRSNNIKKTVNTMAWVYPPLQPIAGAYNLYAKCESFVPKILSQPTTERKIERLAKEMANSGILQIRTKVTSVVATELTNIIDESKGFEQVSAFSHTKKERVKSFFQSTAEELISNMLN